MKRIYLVRHAEAIYDSQLPDAGRPLSTRGLRQADELVATLEELGIEEIHTSPYRRCLHTIAPLSAKLGIEPVVVHDFRERNFTSAHVEDWATTWRHAWMNPDFAFDDGESGRQAQMRMRAAFMELVTTSTARTLAVSSHGNVIALLLTHIDAAFGFEHACGIRNPDVLRVTFDGATLAWDRDFNAPRLETFATTFADRSTQ